jgi:hypothetical protein
MTTSQLRFTSIDWVRVPGRGNCAVVLCDQDRPQGIAVLIGTTVDIDGALYDVISIEAPYLSGPKRKSEQFAAWVRPHVDAHLPNTDKPVAS